MSLKRKRSVDQFNLPVMNDVVINMAESSPEASPKKGHKQKSSPNKKSTCTKNLQKHQNNSLDILENSFKKSNGKSPKSLSKKSPSMFSPAKDTPLKSKAPTKKKSKDITGQFSPRLSFSPEYPDLGSPRTAGRKGDNIEQSQKRSYNSPVLDKSSRKSSNKSAVKRDLLECGLSPKHSQKKHSSSESPDKKPNLSELPVFSESGHAMSDLGSPKTPKKLKLMSPTRTNFKNSPIAISKERDSSLKSPSNVNGIQNKSELKAVKNMLSYKCPQDFVPFSFETSALEYVSSEECNLDNCKLFLIKTPADFPVQKLPSKIILNGVQSFHCNKIPYEVHSIVDEETSSLTSLVHNSQTNQLEQGPPFLGQIHVLQSLNVPHEPSTPPTPERQHVPFPEGLHIRYTPFGSADPVCFSTEHQHVSGSPKKKKEKSKHVNADVTDSACDSSKEKKKKKKKKKKKNKNH